MDDTNKSNNKPTNDTYIKAITDLLENLDTVALKKIYNFVSYCWRKYYLSKGA